MSWDIFPGSWPIWDKELPSTRESLSIWTKAAPVDVTLATPGTAENLYSLTDPIPTVNLITNPSMETGSPPTGYTAAGATLAQSAVVARSATNSLRITPNNAAAGEGTYWSLEPALSRSPDAHYILVVSAYFNDNAGSGNNVRVVIADSSGVTLANGTSVALAANWTGRSVAFYPLPTVAANFRIYLTTITQFGTVFYVDDLQVEILNQSAASAYCDGARGLNYEWEGTAHASRSRRRKFLQAVRGYTLHNTRDIYIAEDRTASTTDGGSRFVRAGTDFWEDFPINVTTNISFVNANVGESPRVYGVVRGVPSGKMTGE